MDATDGFFSSGKKYVTYVWYEENWSSAPYVFVLFCSACYITFHSSYQISDYRLLFLFRERA